MHYTSEFKKILRTGSEPLLEEDDKVGVIQGNFFLNTSSKLVSAGPAEPGLYLPYQMLAGRSAPIAIHFQGSRRS